MSKSLSGTPGLPRHHYEFLKMPKTPKPNNDQGRGSTPPRPPRSVKSAPPIRTPLIINEKGQGPVKTGAVVVNQGMKNQSLKQGVLCPHVGGVLAIETDKCEAFTGGSNLIGKCTIPVHANQRRPVKFGDQKAFKETLEAGIEIKLPGPKDKGVKDASIVSWFQQLASEMVECGLDSVFRVPNSDWTSETYILEDWGRITHSFCDSWLDDLEKGVCDPRSVRVHPPCPHDAQNLLWSGTLILGGCTAAHRLALKEALGPTPDGISLIIWIVQKRHLVQSSCQRELITDLEKLTLSDMPGEDVDALNVKIRKSCKEILQVGPPPLDMALICAKRFLSCQVPTFHNAMMDIVMALERDSCAFTWVEVLAAADAKFDDLHSY